ncbi:MAG: Uncharacterised protein [Opitutia bacterium UBA7350]|nr:MAG: Uncharacterised protein [Opitutae bacterium UBA7350]
MHEAANAFVRRAGSQEVRDLTQSIHGELRHQFGYKRKEFDFRDEEGFTCLNTPGFDLEIRIDQCMNDPKAYLLETRITCLRDPALAENSAFIDLFNPLCHRLDILFNQHLELAEKIDRLETIPEIAAGLDYAPDATSFELRLPSLDCLLEVTETEMHFQLLTLPNLRKLLEHSQRILKILTKAGFEFTLSAE